MAVYNVRLTIEYDGAQFHGWQIQPGVRTVQSELERVLLLATRQQISKLRAAGRTDAGVHARGQVVNFTMPEPVDLRRLSLAVSGMLRPDLAVVAAEYVPLDFDARRCAHERLYVYRLVRRAAPLVLDRFRAWHVPATLDLSAMEQAASMLVGEHDFKSFQGHGCVAKTSVRTILASSFDSDGESIHYKIIGKGFLKQMVRNVIGTLVQVGKRQISVEDFERILAAKDRRKAGPTAPAHGLTLEWVRYPEVGLEVDFSRDLGL